MARLISLLLFVSIVCTGAEPYRYFRKVSKDLDLGAAYFVQVTYVSGGWPAQTNGLRRGDRIIGLDGMRVHELREYNCIRMARDPWDRNLTVNVLRDGKIVDIKIANSFPGGLLGFQSNDINPGVGVPLLADLGVDAKGIFEDVLGKGEPRSMTAYELNQFDSLPHRFYAQVLRLADAETVGVAAWVKAFLRARALLVLERYEDAKVVITDAKLVKTAPTDFFRDLAKFHASIAAKPPRDADANLEHYGATGAFFALCYPMPTVTLQSKGKGFPFDPEFNKNFQDTNSADPAKRQAALNSASHYVNSGGNMGERYLGCVKAAMIDGKNHGGWPYRHAYLYDNRRETVLKDLKKRLEEKPEEKVLTAIGLLCPSIRCGDAETFEKAYKIVEEAGGPEFVIAHGFAVTCLERHGWSREVKSIAKRIRNGVLARGQIGKAASLPVLYRKLMARNMIISEKGSNGFITQSGRSMVGPVDVFRAVPWLVVDALDRPEDVQALRQAAAELMSSQKNAAMGFRGLCRLLCAGNDQPKRAKEIERAETFQNGTLVPTEALAEGITSIVEFYAVHVPRRDKGAWTLNRCHGTLNTRTQRLLNQALDQADQLAKGQPDVADKARKIGAEYCTPFIQLLLADKLDELGETALSKEFFAKGSRYYRGMLAGNLPSKHQRRMELSCDLISTRLGASLLESTRELLDMERSHNFTILANLAGREGRWETATQHLTAALETIPIPDYPRKEHFFADRRHFDPKTHDFALRMAQQWLQNPKVPEPARTRINELLEEYQRQHALEPVAANFHELHAVPAPGPVSMDGDLTDWDLSGSRFVCNNIHTEMKTYSANIAAMHDEQNLYLAVRWNDRTPMRNNSYGTSTWGPNGDGLSVNLMVGKKQVSLDLWRNNWSNHVRVTANRRSRTYTSRQGTEVEGGYGLAFKMNANQKGYVQEVRIPWRAVTGKPIRPQEAKLLLECVWGRTKPQRRLFCNTNPTFQGKANRRKRASYGQLILSETGNLSLPKPEWQIAAEEKKRVIARIPVDTDEVRDLALNKAGTILACAGADGYLITIDMKTHKVTRLTGAKETLYTCAFINETQLCAAGRSRRLMIWDTATGKLVKRLEGHKKTVWSLAVSSDGKLLASAGLDRQLFLWDLVNQKRTQRIPFTKSIRAVAISPDSKMIASACLNRSIYLHDLRTGKEIGKLTGHEYSVRGLAFSPDGKHLVSGSDDLTIMVWDVAKRESISKLTGHESFISDVAWVDNKRFLSAARDGKVLLWTLGTKKPVSVGKAKDGIQALALAPGLIAFGGREKYVVITRLPE